MKNLVAFQGGGPLFFNVPLPVECNSTVSEFIPQWFCVDRGCFWISYGQCFPGPCSLGSGARGPRVMGLCKQYLGSSDCAIYRPCKFVCIKYIKNQEINFGFVDVILLQSGHAKCFSKSCGHVQGGD
jgi:hypothetical protein